MGVRLAWALSLPISVAGWLAAHSVAYRLAAPGGQHEEVLTRTGHDYLGLIAPLAYVGLAVCLLAFGLRVAHASRGRPMAGVKPIHFAVVPLFGFVVQEHLERLAHSGGFPVAAALEPTFLIGLLLQVPFALAALLLARGLLALGGVLGQALASHPPPYKDSAQACPAPAPVVVPRMAGLALGYGQRAPPSAR